MSQRQPRDSGPAGGGFVRREERGARRAAAAARRRRVRRRRAAATILVAAVVVGLLVLGVPGGGSAPQRAGARQTVSSTPSVSPSGPAQAGPRSASPAPARSDQASPVEAVLRYTSYVQLGGHRHPDVALTFDDGPGPYTPLVLRVLERMHAPATFFVIGRSAAAYPSYVRDEFRAGEEVGDHTETHAPLGHLSTGAQAQQLSAAAAAIRHAGAPQPVLMRPPYGSLDAETVQVLHAQRMLMVLWSADTKDYTQPGTSRIAYVAISGAQPGAIILMHDGGGDRSETVAALPRIITRLRQRGFRLVTVSQLVAEDPPPHDQPPPRSLAGF